MTESNYVWSEVNNNVVIIVFFIFVMMKPTVAAAQGLHMEICNLLQIIKLLFSVPVERINK